MLEQAQKRIGHLYPKYQITAELLAERPDLRAQGLKAGDELTVIAWLWARTVKCPNPACGTQMPLISSFNLSTKKGNNFWIEPIVDHTTKKINFSIRSGLNTSRISPKVGRGAQFRCLMCGQVAPESAVRDEFKAKKNGVQLMAIVAEGKNGRIYLPPEEEQEWIALNAVPKWIPEVEMNTETSNLVSGRGYGITHWHEIFSSRQLTALTTFCDLIAEARELILNDALTSQHPDSQAYADAVATYLAFAVDKCSDYWSSISTWNIIPETIRNTFSRQAIPMTWDYAEVNPLSDSTGNWISMVNWVRKALLTLPASLPGIAEQADAQRLKNLPAAMICTDPPYYDNIAYADLSDYFYIWLRQSLRTIYPELFRSILVPKTQELVATPYRFKGNKHEAKRFFEKGLEMVFHNFREMTVPYYPVTIFYAFKQAGNQNEERQTEEFSLDNERVSTGWETMLNGLLASSFEITGTWPMRTELANRSVGIGANALASSIVLVCRPRAEDAPSVSRREFLAALNRELPAALHRLQRGNIAPVDLAQAAIGPGMAIFSRYSAVLESDGSPMSVHTALALINRTLDEYLAEQESEYDSDSRWALAWFEQFGHEAGPYGIAETLSKAKNTGIERLTHAGILEARGGTVRLLRRDELAKDWDPSVTKRVTVWEATQYLIRALDEEGEIGAGSLLGKLAEYGETIRDLAYRLYTLCERKGWAQDATAYNMLIIAWPRLKNLSDNRTESVQESLL
jgi:putative DNA methylase